MGLCGKFERPGRFNPPVPRCLVRPYLARSAAVSSNQTRQRAGAGGEYDRLEADILGPTKATHLALKNAASVASLSDMVR